MALTCVFPGESRLDAKKLGAFAFEPRNNDGAYHATMSYYDSSNSSLKFARRPPGERAVLQEEQPDGVPRGPRGQQVGLRLPRHRREGNPGCAQVRRNVAYTNRDADGLRVELLT
jgi:hypothetical protein